MIHKAVDEFIEKAKNMRVAVIGETITDEFVYVSYEGQSMKSICPVFKLTGRTEIQQGGAAAIANHLKDFVKKTDLFSNQPGEIVKTRYIDTGDQKKHVEINKFDLKTHIPLHINTAEYDVVIVADFGHGFCNNLSINDGFHLMCQTNSNNFGFNRISKWKKQRKKSVCIDLREASLQMNKKASFSQDHEVAELYNYELNTDNLFITVGSEGSLFYDGNGLTRHGSYKSEIVDTIGAGDTFFAFVCLASLLYTGDKILMVPSLAASLSTTWLCNEQSVTKQNLRAYATKFI
jgi:bifunctional ADP-heptose synthase (sugar kinase/adenylyltransferase)